MASICILIDGHGLEIGFTSDASELSGGHRITEHHVDQAGIIRLDHVQISVERDDVVEVHEVNQEVALELYVCGCRCEALVVGTPAEDHCLGGDVCRANVVNSLAFVAVDRAIQALLH